MKVRFAVILPILLCIVSCNDFEPIDAPVTDYDRLQGHWVGHFTKSDNGAGQIEIDSPDAANALQYDFTDSLYHAYNEAGLDVHGVWELHELTIVFDEGANHWNLREIGEKSWEGFRDDRGHGGSMVTTWFTRQ